MSDLTSWLEDLGLGEYTSIFAEHKIGFDVLKDLSDDDLKSLGVTPLGDRKRLLRAIAALPHDGETDAAQSPDQSSPVRRRTGRKDEPERRQLTILFCDLVGSTPLSLQLDPEDLRDVLLSYQQAASAAVERFGGYIARYMGDGILVYFGWPQAQEDQAERAVRAGLAAIDAVRNISLADGTKLASRVGISSGQVVIGDLSNESGSELDAVTGQSPNLAARLQSLAEPDEVIIDTATSALVGSVFELRDLGRREVKGFSEPMTIWKVLGEGSAESRFEAIHAGRMAPFVGRGHELGMIRERWLQAKRGEGQAVLLTGEPGIGKSRLVQALSDGIREEPHFRLRYQCSPFHTGSALYPAIQQLKRAAGFTPDDEPEARLDKLEALLRQSEEDLSSNAPLFAALLSLDAKARYRLPKLSPQQQRDRTIEALIRQYLALSRQRPVLFLVEDAQWIDPTTEALIGEAMARAEHASMLLLITYRPHFVPRWADLPKLLKISLNRLSEQQSVDMVRAIGGKSFSPDAVAQIVNRADGMPLYLEELARSLLESSNGESAVPASLQASLVGRLDRLGKAEKVAQLAATLGRSFHYRFIQAVGIFDETELKPALAAMVLAGLLLQQGKPPQATYTFKHALIQDAAYGTLLRGKRQCYHLRVAEALLSESPEDATIEPELIARHFSLAGDPDRSAQFWLLAGQRAGKRSANDEAIANLENGLQELARLPQSRARDEREFTFRIALGASLLAVKGWSAQEVEANCELTRQLSVEIGDLHKSFAALRGLFNVYLLRGEVGRAQELADRLLAIAQEENEQALLLEGYRTVGMCAFLVGDLSLAHDRLQRGNAIYDRALHHAHAFVYGTDPAVVGLSIDAWVRWLLGEPEQARTAIAEALSLAEALQHPFSLAYARSLAASLYQSCREPETALTHAEAAIAIAEEHDFPYWDAWAGVLRGWAQAALGEPDKGIAALKQGLEIYESTGALQIRPYIVTLLAEMQAWAGRPQQGLATLKGAFGPGNRTDVRFYEAEALRLHGELIRQAKTGDGMADFQRALDLAEEQQAYGLALRAAVSAGRAALEDGETSDARAQLEAVYRRFDAGLDDSDLREARAVLAALDTV